MVSKKRAHGKEYYFWKITRFWLGTLNWILGIQTVWFFSGKIKSEKQCISHDPKDAKLNKICWIMAHLKILPALNFLVSSVSFLSFLFFSLSAVILNTFHVCKVRNVSDGWKEWKEMLKTGIIRLSLFRVFISKQIDTKQSKRSEGSISNCIFRPAFVLINAALYKKVR